MALDTSNYILGAKSRLRLAHVHQDLVLVVGRTIGLTSVDFSVLEGLRTVDRQIELIESGASRLTDPTKSRHVANDSGVCHAVDLGAYVGGSIRWDWPLYDQIAVAMKQSADDLNIKIEWGGDWRTFRDGPHFQLPNRLYP